MDAVNSALLLDGSELHARQIKVSSLMPVMSSPLYCTVVQLSGMLVVGKRP